MNVGLEVLDRSDVLLDLGSVVPVVWHGEVRGPVDAGPLCTEGLERLVIWAPSGRWHQAFSLLAMFRSVLPERCLVLTDALPPLGLVPLDGRVALVQRGRRGPAYAGRGAYCCSDLRTDRIFRVLLAGRARLRPELEPLLRFHQLSGTPHGLAVLQRWRDVLPSLFAGGLNGMMQPELRADLERLAEAAEQGEHAITGGFHALDPVVRSAAEWESGARRYLPRAAAQSPAALAAVESWLAARADWAAAPAHGQARRRVAAARLLHRLVDDPWPSSARIAWLFGEDEAP